MKLRLSKIALPFVLQEQIELDNLQTNNFLINRDREIGTKVAKLSRKKHLEHWIKTIEVDDNIVH